MRHRVLDLIVCPKCRGDFGVQVFREERVADAAGGGATPDSAVEIVEGGLRCHGCGARYPVINGIPRLLDEPLLRAMRPRYPAFFNEHPEFTPRATDDRNVIADTLESFTRQRLDLQPPGPEFAAQWRSHLARNLGRDLGVDALRGKLILDVGCGFGRHLYVASEAGAEVLGIDLSGGVDVARNNNRRHPRCHLVQANIYDRPVREERFDVAWSFGVLHHLPDPRRGFEAMVSSVRPDGGIVAIWVYGYDGMAFTYRLSHMRALHRVTRRMSGPARVRASKVVAALLSAGYWEPLRLAKRVGLKRLVERLPLTEHLEQGWIARVAAVHDRLSTPVTHFHDRDELLDWCRGAQLEDVVVEDTNRRGWRALGHRRVTARMPREVPALARQQA